MRSSLAFVIIIIFVIYLYHPHLHNPDKRNMVLSREWVIIITSIVLSLWLLLFLSYIYITLIYITPTKEIWSYHTNENFYRLCDYYYSCHKLHPKTTVLSREWELLSHFVIIIIFVIYLYHPHLITPTKEIWSYHANENFYRLCDYYYSCHKLQPKTTVLSREWELLSFLW